MKGGSLIVKAKPSRQPEHRRPQDGGELTPKRAQEDPSLHLLLNVEPKALVGQDRAYPASIEVRTALHGLGVLNFFLLSPSASPPPFFSSLPFFLPCMDLM